MVFTERVWKMDKGFVVGKLEPVNPNDVRGATFQWKFPPELAMHQLTFYTRKARKKFGQHVHLGKDPSKNPEMLLIISGRMRVTLVGLDDKTEVVELGVWDYLIIYPGVKHSMKALTNVTIAEPRRTHFNPAFPDTVLC